MATAKKGAKKSTAKKGVGKAVDPAIQKLKEFYADQINAAIAEKDLTQSEAAALMGDHASQISLIKTKTLRGFSTERLQLMLTRLGRNVVHTVSVSGGKSGKITAHAG